MIKEFVEKALIPSLKDEKWWEEDIRLHNLL